MTAFNSPPVWLSEPPSSDGLSFRIFRSNVLVSSVVGACMAFLRHLVEHFLVSGSLETGRVMLRGDSVFALEALLVVFGGTLGIGPASPVLHLNSGQHQDVSLSGGLRRASSDDLVEPWGSILSTTQLRKQSRKYALFAAICMVLAMLTGGCIIFKSICQRSIGDSTKELCLKLGEFCKARTSNSSRKGNISRGNSSNAAERRRPESPNDEEESGHISDSDDDSDDDDPPPPGPSSGAQPDDDPHRDGLVSWKGLGINFVFGYLLATVLKGLRKRTNSQPNVNAFLPIEFVNEWDILEGNYGLSHSRINNTIQPTSFPVHGATHELLRGLMTRIRTVGENIRSNLNFSQTPATVRGYLEIISDTFRQDYVMVVIVSFIMTGLGYRYEVLDDMWAGGVTEEPHDLDPESSKLTEGEKRAYSKGEDHAGEQLVYLDKRISFPLNTKKEDNAGAHVSINWSPPREFDENMGYLQLTDFIARHDTYFLNNENTLIGSVENPGGNKFELAQDTWELIRDDDGVSMSSEHAFRIGDIAEATRALGLDPEIDQTVFADANSDVDYDEDESDVESYVTAGDSDRDGTMMMEFGPDTSESEAESLHSEQGDAGYVVGDNSQDEISDPTLLFPGSFPTFPHSQSTTPRRSISGNVPLKEVSFFASDAVDFGLPRSTLSAADTSGPFRTPPQLSAKRFPSTPPALLRGRKIRLKEKMLDDKKRGIVVE